MKKILYILFISAIILQMNACQKNFLEKRLGSDLNVDSIFSTRQKSLSAIAQAYGMSLQSGITTRAWDNDRANGLAGGTLSHISGEVNAIKFNWEDAWKIQQSGLTSNDGSGRPLSSDGFAYNYRSIRQCYLVIENINKVGDMSEAEKKQVKAEMLTLIAYRYEEMLKRYGGIPIVSDLLSAEGELMIPRATVREVIDHILELCSQAEPDLPNTYPSDQKGRTTKGIPLCIKAETLLFAARPLFNSATPYMYFGDDSKLICIGSTDNTLWQQAADANLAVINWANANGHQIINTGNPFNDYGTAVATPNNAEVLLAFKSEQQMESYDPHTQTGAANAMSYLQLTYYYKADGSNQTWPGGSWAAYNEFITKANAMEARYKISAAIAGQASWNNPGSYNWSSEVMTNASTWAGRGGTEGAGRRVKFWYMAGTRNWFEFPVYRLAEFYLNIAEAYNEANNTADALANINVIRKRAGLPNIIETNKNTLRNIIQRERAVELYEENHRYFDVKHWKLADIGNGIIGGEKKAVVFKYANNGDAGWNPGDYVSYSVRPAYTAYWSQNQYLEPFPIEEVNKKYIVQNPGY